MNELITIENGELTLVDKAVEQFTELIKAKIQYDIMEKELKDQLKQAMEDHGIKSFDHPLLKAVYVAPTTRTRIDGKALEEKYPWIAEEVKTTSEVKSSIRLTIK